MNCNEKYPISLKGRFASWKGNAKVRKREWNLIFADIKDRPQICFYTGIVLTLEKNKFNTLSLDRVDNKKGYTKDNVVLCCSEINYLKYKMNIKQFLERCEKVVKGAINHENML